MRSSGEIQMEKMQEYNHCSQQFFAYVPCHNFFVEFDLIAISWELTCRKRPTKHCHAQAATWISKRCSEIGATQGYWRCFHGWRRRWHLWFRWCVWGLVSWRFHFGVSLCLSLYWIISMCCGHTKATTAPARHRCSDPWAFWHFGDHYQWGGTSSFFLEEKRELQDARQ